MVQSLPLDQEDGSETKNGQSLNHGEPITPEIKSLDTSLDMTTSTSLQFMVLATWLPNGKDKICNNLSWLTFTERKSTEQRSDLCLTLTKC